MKRVVRVLKCIRNSDGSYKYVGSEEKEVSETEWTTRKYYEHSNHCSMDKILDAYYDFVDSRKWE